jgi:hypothetical protein
MSAWQPIETVPKYRSELLLYFPAKIIGAHRQYKQPAMMRIDFYPVDYPRQPTHWMPLPEPPQ